MEIGGMYPMLYAFFDDANRLRRIAHTRQIEAALKSGSSGVAVLGLGTEVAKLGRDERRMLIDWTFEDVAGRAPIAVTVADGNIPDMIDTARYAEKAGAEWLILQPPRPPASSADLIEFFGAVAGAVSCPIGIQNAPEFLGIGLSAEDLIALHQAHPNVSIVKAESTAIAVAEMIRKINGRMKVFNGRAGLELTDNLRAGCDGMIPGIETIDLQVKIAEAMKDGREDEAEALYQKLIPAIAFAMQGLGAFLLYGKLIAAHRLGIEPSTLRIPTDRPTSSGLEWTKRFADALGPLP
ncbi:MAG: dihydrodipicolinate synthase family protein [Alphaproteobacteria bacterium]